MVAGKSFSVRKEQDELFYNRIHRARVTDVNVDKGTMSVLFESEAYPRDDVLIPLLALSIPSKSNPNDKNYMRSAWGRFIPQIDDMVLVGFDTNLEVYSLGYHAVSYEAMKGYDDDNEDRGGIGWGNASGKKLRPGDWDFKSSRNSALYLGDKVKITSGPQSITLDKPNGETVTVTGLLKDRFGEASECRCGDAKRFVIPTDPTETYIPSIFPDAAGRTAQEYNNVIKRGSFVVPLGVPMARFSMGEVIDEITNAVMIPSASAELKSLTNYLIGTKIMMLRSVKELNIDSTGNQDAYIEVVDDFGNYGVAAETATIFQWMSPAATWDVTNLNYLITSLATFTLKSPVIIIDAETSVLLSSPSITLDSINVSLGGVGATNPVVKGNELLTQMDILLKGIVSATAVVGSAPQNAAALTAIGQVCNAVSNSIKNVISGKVFVGG